MTDSFGLVDTDILPLVASISPGEVDREGLLSRFARAAWSGIAEPGDGIAGVLIAAVGPSVALRALIDSSSPETVLAMIGPGGPAVDDVKKALARWSPRLSTQPVLISLRQAVRWKARLLTPGDDSWPLGVDDLGPHSPTALWCRGDASALERLDRSIALVGARAATGYGEHVAMDAAAGLVARDLAIVSGAAYGIDGMAHRAALASGGTTVAFLAGGVDRFYPSGHDALLTRIVETGAVVSELPCGAAPTKWRFLQRNRLIAASSCATVVVEAGARSGSLNTAHHASALGRALGAVPGPVTSAASAGCHVIIRDGTARCVTSAAEMAELVFGEHEVVDPTRSDPRHIRVLDAMSERSPRDVHDIAARSGLSLSETMAVLGTLSMEGAADEVEKGWVARAVTRR